MELSLLVLLIYTLKIQDLPIMGIIRTAGYPLSTSQVLNCQFTAVQLSFFLEKKKVEQPRVSEQKESLLAFSSESGLLKENSLFRCCLASQQKRSLLRCASPNLQNGCLAAIRFASNKASHGRSASPRFCKETEPKAAAVGLSFPLLFHYETARKRKIS